MTTRIVRIGNSRGIRIPKTLLEQIGLGDEVHLEAKDNQLVIRPKRLPREGWSEAFRAMAQRGDDRLIDEPLISQTRWDNEEWQW